MELENKLIGRNLTKFRKMADIKAADLAERIGMKEAAYTKYERGETNITIDLIQKVATALNVDPIKILSASPDNFIESITDSPMAGNSNINKKNKDIDVEGDYYESDKKQTELILKQNETMMRLMEKLIEMLGQKE
jgi:transcriptional regulator with XRE-family HTH domain